jgi:hypothetical protein
MAASGEIRIGYVYITRITVSSINLDAQYISCKFDRGDQTDPTEARARAEFSHTDNRKHNTHFRKWLAPNTLHDKRCFVHVF